MSKRQAVVRRLRKGREQAQFVGWNTVLTGKRISATEVTLVGAPMGKTWVRSSDASYEEHAVWGVIVFANVPVEIGPVRGSFPGDEIKGVNWIQGTNVFGNAVSTVAQQYRIDELFPQNVSGLGFKPGRLGPSASGSSFIRVEPFDHSGGSWLGTPDLDVAAYFPTLPGQYGHIGVYLDPSDNTLHAFAGEQVFDKADFTGTDRAGVLTGMYPLGAVTVVTGGGISTVSEFIDWRLHLDNKDSGGGSGAGELGYTQITSNQTTNSSTFVDVPGLSVTVTIGSRPVKITLWTSAFDSNTVNGGRNVLQIYDDTAGAEVAEANCMNYGGNASECTVIARVHPAAGSRTYKARFETIDGSSASRLIASLTSPAFIVVEEI